MKTSILLSALWIVLSLATHAECGQPNIVLIMVDDLGVGDVSCLFRDEVKTPNIDRLAERGVKFTQGYASAPICGPSRAGFFTGRYQQKFGFINNTHAIPADEVLLPKVLKDAGYTTALFGKWHGKGSTPFERGCFDETLCSEKSSPFIDYDRPRLSRNGAPAKVIEKYSTDLLAEEAVSFIERNKDKPFALTVTFNAPHIAKVVLNAMEIQRAFDQAKAEGKIMDVPKAPMARPGEAVRFAERYPGDSARADTVACIMALDEAVGVIMKKLHDENLAENTIVFFLGDNGGHPENRSENDPLSNYKWTLYEGGIRVPFFAVYPGVFPAGLTYDEPVIALDIFPTCATLAGARLPANLDGIDLTPYLTGQQTQPPHRSLYFGIESTRVAANKGRVSTGAIRQGEWKLHVAEGQQPELYNIVEDKEERHNLSNTQPDRTQAMQAEWTAWDATQPRHKHKP